MSKGLELYKAFIDGLVERKNGVEAKRIMGKGYPRNEDNKERTLNILVQSIPERSRQIVICEDN